MSRPIWFVNLLKKHFPQRFLFARLTRLPGIGALVDRALFDGDDLVYLPPDHSISVNEEIEEPEDLVLPSRLVDEFIRKAHFHWIMDFCICRESNHCEHYPRRIGCLFLGEAARDINPRLGRQVTQEEALDHVRRCRDAGLVHLVGRNKLDTVWLGVGPGEKLLTICNCCPCCCLWKMLPELNPRIGHKVARLPGVEVRVTDRCQACGTCASGVCFVDAIRLLDGRARIDSACRGCGRCVDACPNGAIELTIDESAGVGEALRRLSQRVDLG